jgi:hypothetical protein
MAFAQAMPALQLDGHHRLVHAQPHAPEILHHLFTHAWVKPLFNSNWGAAPEPSVHNGKSPSPNLVLDIKLLPRDLACGPESIWGRLI